MKVLARLGLRALRCTGQLSSSPWRASPGKFERKSVTTTDGWQLKLRRLRRSEQPKHGPLLFVHGLAASHHTFHLPERSLAEFLADQGFDCWLMNLRGRLDNTPPEGKNGAYDWSFDDYIDKDLPAIIEFILKECHRDTLHLLGQSMGGVLIYLYGIRHGTKQYRSCVISASGLDYKHGKSGFTRFLGLKKLVAWLPWIPYGSALKTLTPLLGRFNNPLERFSYNLKNIEGPMVRRLVANNYQDIAPGVLLSLSSTFQESGFKGRDGFVYKDHAQNFKAPVLALAGDVDQQVSPQAVQNSLAMIGSEDKKYLCFGPEHGQTQHFGHADLINGLEAPKATWPAMLSWLQSH